MYVMFAVQNSVFLVSCLCVLSSSVSFSLMCLPLFLSFLHSGFFTEMRQLRSLPCPFTFAFTLYNFRLKIDLIPLNCLIKFCILYQPLRKECVNVWKFLK
jgi:hypothetical protein